MNTRPVLIDQFGNPLAVDITGISDGDVLTYDSASGLWVPAAAGGTGAPDNADYLVGTANGSLSNEIVVGTTPGGELGGTWASPTVDATHSGSAHHTRLHTVTDTNDHTFPGGTTTFLRADGTFATPGGAGPGGAWDVEIVKTTDDDRTTNGPTQDTDLHFVTTSGVWYQFEALVWYAATTGGTAADARIACGEDVTVRGVWTLTGYATGDQPQVQPGQVSTNVIQVGTAASAVKRVAVCEGTWLGNGGTFAVLTALVTGGGNVVRFYADSILRYRVIA